MKSMIKNFAVAALAALVTIGVNAAPANGVAKKISAKQIPSKEITTDNVQPKAATVNFDMTARHNQIAAEKKAAKVGNPRANKAKSTQTIVSYKKIKPATVNTGRRNSVKKANVEYNSLTATKLGGKDYGVDYWYYFQFNNNDVFYFDVFYTGSVENGRTYTYAEMDHDYSWCQISGAEHSYTDADFTIDVDEDGLTHAVAHAVLDNGAAYEIRYDQQPVPTEPLGEVYLNGTISSLLDFTADDGMFQFKCDLSDGGKAYFTGLSNSSVTGTYSTYDGTIADGYTFMSTASGAEVSFLEGEFTVTEVAGGYEIRATLVGEDYYIYYFTITKREAATINIAATKYSANYYASDNDWYCVLQDASGNAYVFDIVADELVDGKEYTLSDMLLDYTYVNYGGTKHFTDEASFTITHDEAGLTTINAVAKVDSGDTFVVKYEEVPLIEPTEEVTIEANNLVMDNVLYDWFGEMIFEAHNDEYGVDLWIYTYDASGVGHYTGTEIDEYSSVRPMDGSETEYLVVAGDVTVSKQDGNLVLTGWVQCENNVKYNLNLVYEKPEATREMTITVVDGKLNNLIDAIGAFQVMGYSEDGTQYATVAVYANSLTGTFGDSDIMPDYTYGAEIVGNGAVYYDYIEGEFQSVQDGEYVVVTGWMLAQNEDDPSDAPMITVSIRAKEPEPGVELDYDTQDADIEMEYSADEYAINTNYLQHGLVYIETDGSNGTMTMLEFHVADGEETIPSGTYEINYSGDAHTFTACPGVDSEGYITGSFIGTLDEEGYIGDVWFLVRGTVTVVNNNGEISAEVDGFNSFGRTVKIVLGSGVAKGNVVMDEAGKTVLKSNYAGDIVIPAEAEAVAASAFSMCVNVTSIKCLAENAPACGATAFYKLNPAMPVYVPASAVEAYKAAEGWKMFKNIQAIAE